MILFRSEHVASIVEGRKTQTRRLGKRRWLVGSVHQARTRMLDAGSTFARLRVLSVRREYLNEITGADARAEGYDSRDAFLRAFWRLHPALPSFDPPVWVVEFEKEP